MRTRIAILMALAGACSKDEEPPVATGTARQITAESELIGGLEAAGRVGDYLLDSGKVRFVVQAPGSASGWGLYGGSIVDLDRSGPSALGEDRLQEIFFQCNLRAFGPTSIEVTPEGLRMKGKDRGIPLLDAIIPSPPNGLDITIDLILRANSETLEIRYDVADTAREELRNVSCGVVLLHGDEYAYFAPGAGPELSGGDLPWIANAAPHVPASYVIHPMQGTLSVVAAFDEVVPISTAQQGVFPGGRFKDSIFVSVGERSVESALQRMRAAQGDTGGLKAFAIPVFDGGLEPATVTVRDQGRPEGGDHLTMAHVDRTTDMATFEIPDGAQPLIEVRRDGRLVASQALIGPLTLVLPRDGAVIVEATEIDLAGVDKGLTPARVFIDDAASGGRVVERYVGAGERITLPPGMYRAVVARGVEHELWRGDFEVKAGEDTRLAARIEQVVDTSGWVTVDTHVHSTKSVDSDAPLVERVIGAVAEGLDVLLSTDHDVVIDYAPTVARLGLQDRLVTETGTEISPLYGHFNAWPLTPGKYWEVAWFEYMGEQFVRQLDPHEIVPLAKAKGASIVQINHPRGSKGVFDFIDLDPAANTSRKAWPEADCVEVMNDKGYGFSDEVLQDLYGAWKHDRRITATAVSDAHGKGSQIGYGRTAIRGDKSDLPALWAALKQGRAVAMNGPFVTLTARAGASRAEVGEVLASSGQPIQLDLVVEAPSWMDVSRVTVIADGATLFTQTLSEADRDATRPAVRIRKTITATPTADAFFLAIAEGDGRNEPVMNAKARSITNPVFVDANGGGYRWSR